MSLDLQVIEVIQELLVCLESTVYLVWLGKKVERETPGCQAQEGRMDQQD